MVHVGNHANPCDVIVEGSVAASSTAVAQPPEDGLTDLQRRFVDEFIANGGRAGDAAIAAGYGGGAEGMGLRNLAKPKIQAAIEKTVKSQRGSALAIALARGLDIIQNSKDDKAAVTALLGIMDRFGMSPPKGPLVAIQNNTITGSEASRLINDVMARRQQRLSGPDGE